MQETILILGFVAITVFGYFVMLKIDSFLDKNYKEIHKQENSVPKQVVRPKKMPKSNKITAPKRKNNNIPIIFDNDSKEQNDLEQKG